jgi:prepilin-type N-terminal cleavage/methylation domain-containing protein
MKSLRRTRQKAKSAAGFTLIEVMVAAALATLLLFGGLALFICAIETSSRSGAQVSTTSKAAVTINHILSMSRECYGVALPTDASGFVPPKSGTTAASYITTDGSAAALQLTTPANASVTVINSAGTAETAGTNFPMTYTNTASGPTLTIYRSDASGNPAPNNGQDLWEVGTPPGQPALPAAGERLVQLAQTAPIAAAIPDLATFVRTPDALTTVPTVEIHIIAADYSIINGTETNEKTGSQIVGKCVLLRNHP